MFPYILQVSWFSVGDRICCAICFRVHIHMAERPAQLVVCSPNNNKLMLRHIIAWCRVILGHCTSSLLTDTYNCNDETFNVESTMNWPPTLLTRYFVSRFKRLHLVDWWHSQESWNGWVGDHSTLKAVSSTLHNVKSVNVCILLEVLVRVLRVPNFADEPKENGGPLSSPTCRHNDSGSEGFSMMMLGTAQLFAIRGPTIIFLHSRAQITSNGLVYIYIDR